MPDRPCTVVLLPPLDQSCEHFDGVRPLLPARWPVLAVDRPRRDDTGTLRPPVPSVRTLYDDLADVDEAMRGATSAAVLVGASYGGLLARVQAARHPDRVAGLVLVDAVHEGVHAAVVAVVGPEAEQLLDNGEGLDLPVTFVQAGRLLDGSTLGDLPVLALTRDRLREDERAVHPRVDDLDRVWRVHQELLGRCSTRARMQVVEGAGHFIARERPERVAAAVLEVVAAAR